MFSSKNGFRSSKKKKAHRRPQKTISKQNKTNRSYTHPHRSKKKKEIGNWTPANLMGGPPPGFWKGSVTYFFWKGSVTVRYIPFHREATTKTKINAWGKNCLAVLSCKRVLCRATPWVASGLGIALVAGNLDACFPKLWGNNMSTKGSRAVPSKA